MNTAPTHTPSADSSTSPVVVTREQTMPAPTVAAAGAHDAMPERLHYLFRRTSAHNPTNLLKKAIFEYRGVPLP